MKPARLLGILFMVTVLIGMFAVIGFGLFGFGHVLRTAIHEDSGMEVQQAHTELQAPYKSVTVSGPIDLVWVRDTKASFDVTGNQKLCDRLKYEVKGDSIEFKLNSGMSWGGHVKVTLHGPQPDNFVGAGSGDAEFHGLKKGAMNVTLAGSGNADLSGEVDSIVVSVAGSGDVKGLDLVCNDATVSIAGSGNVNVSPKKALTASIMGSGDIGYRGDPQITKTILGSGDIEKKD